MYFNTTTIPSEYINNKPDIWSGLCYGLFFTITFVGGFVRQIYINYEKDASETSSSSESSAGEAETSASEAETSASASEAEASDSESETVDTSIADFSILLDRELTEEELQQLQFKIVRETTASGDIVMTYHKDTESFWYYADHLKDIHYSMLETVARKFVIEHNCKRIYMQTADVDNIQNEQHVKHVQNIGQEQPNLVFAKFKKYNSGGKGSNPNFKTSVKVIEQTNHFRYKGKLNAYADVLKERAEKEKAQASPILDYAAYRDLLKDKKEN